MVALMYTDVSIVFADAESDMRVDIVSSELIPPAMPPPHPRLSRHSLEDTNKRQQSPLSKALSGVPQQSPSRRSSLSLPVTEFSFEDLYCATSNFSSENLIGQGGFGTVYKGELPDGRLMAVKRLYPHKLVSGTAQMKSEVPYSYICCNDFVLPRLPQFSFICAA